MDEYKCLPKQVYISTIDYKPDAPKQTTQKQYETAYWNYVKYAGDSLLEAETLKNKMLAAVVPGVVHVQDKTKRPRDGSVFSITVPIVMIFLCIVVNVLINIF